MILEHLKHFFVPHEGNNYKPHALHTKRAVFYASLFAVMKAIVFVFALLLPAEVFLVPDVLQQEMRLIVDQTNAVRAQKGLPKLAQISPLTDSASARATDMSALNYFSHQGPNGHTLRYFLKNAKYNFRVAGENLAMGFSDAASVVNAWIKSPTHYANLVDDDFTEIGVGVVAGYYNGQPTVFMAQHFGDPLKMALEPSPFATALAVASSSAAMTGSTAPQEVRGEKITAPATTPPVVYDHDRSRVYWTDQGSTTKFDARVYLDGPVKSVVVNVHNYPIELRRISPGLYGGTITALEPVNNFFDPVIMPTITVTDEQGVAVVQDTVDWFDIKVVGTSPIQKYLQAKKFLSPITNIFNVTRDVYLAFLALFTIALVINIVVEVRRQHYHIIAQTLLIMAFLVWLLWV